MPGEQIAIAGTTPNIGAYVQDTLEPSGDTSYIGCNPKIGYDRNVLGASVGAVCPVNTGVAQTTKTAIWSSSAVVLIPTDRVDVTAGVATKNNATGAYDVLANVPAAGYFWAVLR